MVLLFMYTNVIRWLEEHMLVCPSVKWFRLECMGCGMQRSAVALLKGDLVQSVTLYPALIPMLFLCLFAAGHLIFKFSGGARVIVMLQLLVVTIVLVHYFYKIITSQIFI
ncbi:MAG: DUF2752 domain-containing protein [Chitinophagaceae bacterium]|nr:DUF2752 domain-containing protein [Chitinophagaceae bacterium]MCW5927152.1 DUF2752 domain-containing protein [Chitinophagaceae bacterium]